MSKQQQTIKTKDGLHEYPVDFVREYFINSDESLKDMAIQLNLPLAVVQLHAKQGMVSWYQLQEARMEERMTLFRLKDIDSLMSTHSYLDDAQFLTLAQYKGHMEFLKQYVLKHGHLFAVDDEGNIRYDSTGSPIYMPIPNTPKHFMAIEGFLRIKEGTKMAMNHLYEQSQKSKDKNEMIDIEDDPIFREVKS
jgi:hypothetical protein